MRRWIAAVGIALGALAWAAGPASANVPSRNGLEDFGVVTCEGIGDVAVFGPRGEGAATAFATSGQHVVLQAFDAVFTDTEGHVFTFSKSFGQKAGLTTFTCTQHFAEPDEGTGDITAVVAVGGRGTKAPAPRRVRGKLSLVSRKRHSTPGWREGNRVVGPLTAARGRAIACGSVQAARTEDAMKDLTVILEDRPGTLADSTRRRGGPVSTLRGSAARPRKARA
jgi:hypothetical protein